MWNWVLNSMKGGSQGFCQSNNGGNSESSSSFQNQQLQPTQMHQIDSGFHPKLSFLNELYANVEIKASANSYSPAISKLDLLLRVLSDEKMPTDKSSYQLNFDN